MNNFGTVTFMGKVYTLTDYAQPTSSLLNYPKNYHEVADGEEFEFEMSAPAVDDEGEKYEVRWIFADIKGQEKDLDCFDYDDVYDVDFR